MSKHTPGPWHWDSDPLKGDPLGRVRYRVTTTGKTITQCYYSSSDVKAEWDARLIASAPELLEALRMGYAETMDYIRLNNLGADDNHWLRLARAAIAKATGEQP